MYEQRLVVQDCDAGLSGTVLSTLTRFRDCNAETFFAAVAYATEAGCELLLDRLGSGFKSTSCRKRWLISMDFGRTEPAALEMLANLPNSEVRIPNGVTIVSQSAFIPPIVFHPKVFAAGRGSGKKLQNFSVVSGSANLTGSALVSGVEAVCWQSWNAPLALEERESAERAVASLKPLETVWLRADALSLVLPKYKSNWIQQHHHHGEDEPAAVKAFVEEGVLPGTEAVEMSRASALWIEAGNLYKNRGPAAPGNQLDCPRGARVFFGFSPAAVPRNTVFGPLMLRYQGYQRVERTMRFGNNMMDKINLPIPGESGPATYDGSLLLFSRTKSYVGNLRVFELRSISHKELVKLKSEAKKSVEKQMHGGRRYGLLFV